MVEGTCVESECIVAEGISVWDRIKVVQSVD